jgi:adenosine 3'-phospho 5'-phosphosulfate transporter B3
MLEKNEIRCLCLNLTVLNRQSQFLILCLAVFAFHLVQGYMHELIFKLPGFKPYSMFLTLVQFGIYSVLAILETLLSNRSDFRRVFDKK